MDRDRDDQPGLHVEVRPGQGPYALFVHGMLTSRAQWLTNLEALASVCQPVVVELLGHGRSPAPQRPDAYDPAAYVASFESIRRSLDVERWFLIGQSLGGALTMRYALDHPDRVLGHVFTNSSSALADEARRAEVARTIPAVADRIEARGADAITALPQHPSRGRRLPEHIKAALVADAALLDPAGVARTLRHTVPGSSCRRRAPHNRVPTLLVNGTRERGFREARRYAEQTMPHLTVVEADAGHAVNIQAADTFNAAVASFIRDRTDQENRHLEP